MKALEYLSTALEQINTAKQIIGTSTSTKRDHISQQVKGSPAQYALDLHQAILPLELNEVPFLDIPLDTLDELSLYTAFNMEAVNLAGAFDIEEMNLVEAFDIEELNLGAAFDIEEINLAGAFDIEEMNLAEAFDIEELNLGAAFDIEEMNLAGAFDIEEMHLAEAFDIEELNLGAAFDIEESSEDPNDWGRPTGPNRSDSVMGPGDGPLVGSGQPGIPPISPFLNLNDMLSIGGINLGTFIGFEGYPTINPLE